MFAGLSSLASANPDLVLRLCAVSQDSRFALGVFKITAVALLPVINYVGARRHYPVVMINNVMNVLLNVVDAVRQPNVTVTAALTDAATSIGLPTSGVFGFFKGAPLENPLPSDSENCVPTPPVFTPSPYVRPEPPLDLSTSHWQVVPVGPCTHPSSSTDVGDCEECAREMRRFLIHSSLRAEAVKRLEKFETQCVEEERFHLLEELSHYQCELEEFEAEFGEISCGEPDEPAPEPPAPVEPFVCRPMEPFEPVECELEYFDLTFVRSVLSYSFRIAVRFFTLPWPMTSPSSVIDSLISTANYLGSRVCATSLSGITTQASLLTNVVPREVSEFIGAALGTLWYIRVVAPLVEWSLGTRLVAFFDMARSGLYSSIFHVQLAGFGPFESYADVYRFMQSPWFTIPQAAGEYVEVPLSLIAHLRDYGVQYLRVIRWSIYFFNSLALCYYIYHLPFGDNSISLSNWFNWQGSSADEVRIGNWVDVYNNPRQNVYDLLDVNDDEPRLPQFINLEQALAFFVPKLRSIYPANTRWDSATDLSMLNFLRSQFKKYCFNEHFADIQCSQYAAAIIEMAKIPSDTDICASRIAFAPAAARRNELMH